MTATTPAVFPLYEMARAMPSTIASADPHDLPLPIFAFSSGSPWAIREVTLQALARSCHDRSLGSLQTRLGRLVTGPRKTTHRHGIAILSIVGPIFRYANILTEMGLASSAEALALDFRAALDHPQTKAVMLAVDSDGGQVDGISEMAQTIFAARSTKRIWAHVDGTAASAAYWLASAAERLVLSNTAAIGGLGIVTTSTNHREADAQLGIRRIEIVSSRAPNKRPDPTTDNGRALILARLDAIEDVQIAAVARQRGVDTAKVIAEFGQGALMPALKAVAAGMADAIGTFEGALAALAGAATAGKPATPLPQPFVQPPAQGVFAMPTTPVPVPPAPASRAPSEDEQIARAWNNLSDVRAEFGDFETYKAYRAAVASGRVQIQGRNELTGLEKVAGHAADPGAPEARLMEDIRAEWRENADIRREFRTLDTYAAYRKAASAGLVHGIAGGRRL